MADEVQALFLLSPSKSKWAAGQVRSTRVSEFLPGSESGRSRPARSRQQEPGVPKKRLWLGWKAQTVPKGSRMSTARQETGMELRPKATGAANLLQGLLRLAGDQPRETLAGFRGWEYARNVWQNLEPGWLSEMKNTETSDTESSIREPGERGGLGRRWNLREVRVFHFAST